MRKNFTFLIVFISICLTGFSQPANDDCSNATAISIPSGGNACTTGTTVGATPTTWGSAVCGQTNWTNDVWFTFVSTGTDNTVIVSPTGTPAAQTLGVSVYTGTCGGTLAGSPGSCAIATTPGGIDTAIYPAPVGTVFYVEVSSFGTAGNFQICVNSTTPPAAPGNSCATAARLCTEAPFSVASVPHGGSSFTPSCFGVNTPTDGEWYQFTVGVSGELAWRCTPTGIKIELDWALYDITNGCPTNATSQSYMNCNFNFSNEKSNPIGMSPTTNTQCPPDSAAIPPYSAAKEFCPWENVVAGHTYAIFINNYTYPKATGWNFNFDSSTFKMAPVDTFLVSPDTICGNTGVVNITNNSVAAVWQNWNFGDGNTSPAISPGSHTYSTPGTYFISLTDSSQTGCVAVSSKAVLVTPYPTVTVSNDTVCPGVSATLTANPSVPGGKYVWSNGATTATITESPPSSTSYTVTYTSPTGCSASASATIVVNSPTASINPPTSSVCPGSSATLTATTAVSYAWSDGETTGTVTVTPASNTTYQVTVTFAGGCTATASSSVTISNNATTTITPPTSSVCPGINTTLTAGSGTAYLWSNGSTTASITVSPSTTTTYYVTVTVTGTCFATASATVTMASTTGAITPGTATICPGGSATFSANPANSYLWSNGATTASITVSPLATTNYAVTVTSAGGCTATATATLTVSNNLTSAITPQPDTICTGASATLAASAASSYLWSDGSTTGSITVSPVATSSYSVTTTSGGTCSASASATVVVAPFVISINPASTNICAGSSTTLTCSYHTNTYSWNPAQIGVSQGVVVSPMATTTYSVTATNNNNCTASASAIVNVDAPSVSISPVSAAICSGQSTTLTASGVTGYAWSNGSLQAGITVSPVTTTTYVVSGTDAQGCVAIDSAIVTIGAIPTALFTVTSPLCVAISGAINYTGVSSPAAVYAWSFGGGNVISGTGKGPYLVSWNNAGSDTVSLIVTDNGCVSAPDTMVVTVNAPPVADAGPDTSFCSGSQVTIGSTAIPGYSYVWTPSSGLSNATVSNPAVTLLNTGNGPLSQTFIVTADNNGCTSSDSVNVIIESAPIAQFAHQQPQCLNINKFNFVAGGTFLNSATFAWTFGNNATPATSVSQTPSVTYSVPQTTAVSLTISQSGCISNIYIDSVTVNPVPVAAFAADTLSGCPNLNVCFINNSISSGNTIYLWTFGDGQTSALKAPCHVYATPGIYTVNLEVTANGCSNDSASLNMIRINAAPVARFLPNTNTIQQPQSEIDFTNLSTNALTYLWNFGGSGSSTDINPSFNFAQYGLYNVVLNAYNVFGCSDSFMLPIKVLPPQNYFIPNVFTPNNDGNNDNFYVEMQEGVTVLEFTVYDRWGEKVHDGLYPWEGTYKGKPAPEGVYVYVIKLQLATNVEPIRRTGSVSLVR